MYVVYNNNTSFNFPPAVYLYYTRVIVGVAELVDALVLGTSGRDLVEVQVLFPTLKKSCNCVPKERIELSLPKEHDFESCASTNSATSAYILSIYILILYYR